MPWQGDRILRPARRVSVALLFACTWAAAEETSTRGWAPLFNGRDLTGWETWLGIPDKSVAGLDLPRDQDGRYAEVLGLNRDPKQVFSVVEVDGKPAIRISGEIFGALTGKQVRRLPPPAGVQVGREEVAAAGERRPGQRDPL
jgi:hypothetical protein